MSMDNTILMLITPTANGGREYRVKDIQAIEEYQRK